MFEKVLVAIDGSDHAARTVEAAKELAEKMGSEIRVLHVEEMGFAGRAGQVELEERDAAHKVVDDAVSSLQGAGLTVTGTVRAAQTHRVASEIADEARESGSAAIIVGRHGRSGIEGVLIGSTTNKLLHAADVTVVVVQ